MVVRSHTSLWSSSTTSRNQQGVMNSMGKNDATLALGELSFGALVVSLGYLLMSKAKGSLPKNFTLSL
jgi:hypothetical protein